MGGERGHYAMPGMVQKCRRAWLDEFKVSIVLTASGEETMRDFYTGVSAARREVDVMFATAECDCGRPASSSIAAATTSGAAW